ncbi:MAG: DMT family transporter [Hyphomicrobiales bacterium]|nr:DMT family transporter [Hyphomicrobiales bacterium]
MPSQTPAQPLRAGLYMVIAMACFILNDSCIKIIGTTLPLGQIITIRGVLSMLVVALICAHQGVLGSLPALFTPKVLARSLLDVAGTFLFLTALMHMPLANLTAILQSVPLAVVLVSVIFLKEKVGMRRTTAIVTGFLGVLLIVRPTPSTFTIYELLALGIVFILAFRDLITKRIPAHIPTFIIALANASFVALGGIIFGFYQGFLAVAPWQFGLLAAAAVLLATGYVFMVATLRLGDLSGTAPFRYSNVLFAIILGMVFFGEFPDTLSYAGMGLIIAAGLYAAHREAVLGKAVKQPL